MERFHIPVTSEVTMITSTVSSIKNGWCNTDWNCMYMCMFILLCYCPSNRAFAHTQPPQTLLLTQPPWEFKSVKCYLRNQTLSSPWNNPASSNLRCSGKCRLSCIHMGCAEPSALISTHSTKPTPFSNLIQIIWHVTISLPTSKERKMKTGRGSLVWTY